MHLKKMPTMLGLLLLAGLLLVACQPIQPSPPTPTPAPEPTQTPVQAPIAEVPDEETYRDPQERFTVPIPTNWTVAQAEGYAVLTSPDEAIDVYVLTVEAASAEAGLERAWSVVDPDFDLAQQQLFEIPNTEGERAISVVYETDGEQRVVSGDAHQYQGITYALLLRGDLTSVQQRGSQLQIIASGLDILAAEEVDLTGATPAPITPEMLDELETYITDAMDRFGIPGAVVAIVEDDEIIYSGGFGVRALGSDEPMTADTRVMIGSTGKTFTTLLMAQLVDEGIIDWDTRVVDIIPTFALADPEITQQITVQNLVCACTGVPRRDLEIFFNYDVLSAEAVVESLATFETFTGFGEAFQYSNQMVATGGYVAAAATGAEYGNLYDAYAELLQTRVLEPIGMPRTTISFDTVLAGDNYATPHSRGLTEEYYPIPLDWERFVTPLAPAGAHWSTAADMSRYLITQLNNGVTPDGTRIVSQENLLHTREAQVSMSADTSYALGWFISEYKGLRVVSHGGNTVGFSSELAFLPEVDIGISVVTNAGITNPFNESVRNRLLELVYAQPPEAEAQAAAVFNRIDEMLSPPESMRESVDPARVELYLGRYYNDALNVIELRFENDTFVLDTGEFITELRPILPEEEIQGEEVEFVLYDTLLAGTPVVLRMTDDGTTEVVFGEGVTQYTFAPFTEE
jgi:CubicO group peptidase (beta-lactamase class C family)